ncbi:hypothetical protein RB595_005880 [Gaeumannomyces hyphopodioides]
MADQAQIIQDYPIRNGLDSFRASFNTFCAEKGIACTSDAFDQLDLEGRNIALDLLAALQGLRASRQLRSRGGSKILHDDLSRLGSAIISGNLYLNRIKPLLNAVLFDHPGDALIWDRVYDAVTESTPPPRPIASSLRQTPWLRNTSSFASSCEHRDYIDKVLKEELGLLYVDLEDFHKTYFSDVPNLETTSGVFFEGCLGGDNPLFENGWKGWPEKPTEPAVILWFEEFMKELAAFANSRSSVPAYKRKLWANPDTPIDGSVAVRKMDIGFVDDTSTGENSKPHWSQIIVPGELKSNPSADRALEAWLDIGRYSRKVLAAQDTRRFVLGFTLCGSLMRTWVFDRLGGIASEQFDINKNGLRFVSTILGFLWMNEEELGFDPTIMTAEGRRFIEIEREGTTERLILDKLMVRARCVSGRATTCWKAYREKDPDTLFVVKDSWQYVERDEEGELLREATSKGVVHVARYHHHETVRVRNMDDEVRNNVRKALDVTKTKKQPQNPSRRLPGTSTTGSSRVSGSSTAGAKRSFHETSASSPPSKRHCSTSQTKAGSDSLSNRVHRRVILSDWGIPIYKAASPKVLLAALADCIEGHESLRQRAGLLHRDCHGVGPKACTR